ncbi:MAG: ChaN family lipoprotein [Bacteriovoracaceae bacterium]|nr:ChaN family lipoprotein [Bacteriovoracaceae bacterium]
MKKKAMSYEGELSKEFKVYLKDQKKYASRTFENSDLDELLKSIKKSDLVYLGDFHSFDQSSRNLERLLRNLIKTKSRKLSLGVEFVHIEHQVAINQYLDNLITEYEFLESINYHESWRFPWNHYRIFFQMAKKHNLKIIALNSTGTLGERDNTAADIISDFISENLNTTLLVLFGELHIVPNKLPAMTQERNTNINHTIIHQNLDEVYWSSIEDDSDLQVAKFNDTEYSLQTSPPWVKYESMIYWYENLVEDPEFEIHEYIMDTGLMAFNSSVPENFLYIAEKVSDALNLEISHSDLEDFNLYDHSKLEYMFDTVESLEKSTLKTFHKKLLSRGRSFKIPYKQVYYCPSYSINRLSFLSGIHLQNIVMKKVDSSHEEVLEKGDKGNILLFFIYQMTIAYFSSKIINPYRKCNLYKDIQREFLNPSTNALRKNILETALQCMDADESKDQFISDIAKGKTHYHLHQASRLVGYFLGDLLYDDFYAKKNTDLSELLKTLLECPFSEKEFNSFKWNIFPRADYKNLKKRFF